MKWIKIIILCCIVFMTSCYKEDIEPIKEPITDIFSVSETQITNGQEVSFDLESNGIFILKLIDYETNQVLSKEKINLVIGKNKIKIFTKSISNQYLYLVIENSEKIEIKKTKLKLK